jgi:hypothetical protein
VIHLFYFNLLPTGHPVSITVAVVAGTTGRTVLATAIGGATATWLVTKAGVGAITGTTGATIGATGAIAPATKPGETGLVPMWGIPLFL